MRPIATATSDFASLRKDGCIYADKTAYFRLSAANGGCRFTMEDMQVNGRADVVANHAVGTFVFELKVDEPVDKAFAQIRAKNYAAPHLASGKPIWLVGLSFDSKTRHLVDCAAERL